MSERILLSNAREAWLQACTHCNLIIDGYVTLQYKKIYISMLHNSVELLMKQRMLDINDYRVAKVRKIDAFGQPAKEYFSSNDLNEYFKTNGTKDYKGKSLFYSIEFHEFHDIHKEIFKDFYDSHSGFSNCISEGLTLLERLRNDETHFYIKDIDFLSGTEFKTLQSFMISFAEVLDYYDLLPTFSENVTNKIKPNSNLPAKSDYRIFLKENDDVKVISNYLNGKTSRGKCDAFDIIDFLWFNTNFDKGSINCNYNEAISLMTGLIQYDLVKIRTKKETQEDGTVLQYHVYDFKI